MMTGSDAGPILAYAPRPVPPPIQLMRPRLNVRPKTLIPLALLTLLTAGCEIFGQRAKDPPLAAVVVRISEEYANINTDLSAESLTTAGITQTTVFTATFKGRQITALLGSSYSDVNRGDWIAQIEDDGNMQLAISFGHAATELNCSVGDTLFVHPPPR